MTYPFRFICGKTNPAGVVNIKSRANYPDSIWKYSKEVMKMYKKGDILTLPGVERGEDLIIKVEYPEEELEVKIEELAQMFLKECQNGEIIAFRILEGASRFADRFADALLHLTNYQLPVNEQSVKITRYGKKTRSNLAPRMIKGIDLKPEEMAGKTIVVLDAVIDQGITMEFFVNHLINYLGAHKPKKIVVVSLISKVNKNKEIIDQLPIDQLLVGWEVLNDKYFIGFGLDHEKLYRGLPFIVFLISAESEEEKVEVKRAA